ncbi:hypothetical protein HanXRQr2_Chr16g0754241 [Helianthus annuus]|uniref:Transmembrane protein n=1 Tax=Helianthus annuus TaxID=4232 RepID=A0A9K3DS22_HELAN|nr:hypothetical protein HanXRQr2_Chr16g0754241 [Helianthus annuus]
MAEAVWRWNGDGAGIPVVNYVALALVVWRWRGVIVVVQYINIRSRVCFHFFRTYLS